MPDKTIGLYVEEAFQNEGDYCTVFYNFSLNWLTKGEDGFVHVTETYDDNNIENILEVYPVPAYDILNIKSENINVINIYDMKGQLVMKLNGDTQINVSTLASGIYFIEGIDVNSNVKTNTIIIK